jgi:SAM-dependent methyltransferase
MASDHFSGHAADYAKARPSYPPELFAWLAQQCAGHDLTWDCGTGNGQAARALAEHFRRVHATDLSAEQIAQAEPDPRIDYLAAPAEVSGLPDRCCDLVTVAQALHWFCGEPFYAEVQRVLKPGGVFAAWTYTLLRGEAELNAIVEDFYRNTIGPWWPPERHIATCLSLSRNSPRPNSRSCWNGTWMTCWHICAPGRQRSATSGNAAAIPVSNSGIACGMSGRIRRRESPSSGPLHFAAGE